MEQEDYQIQTLQVWLPEAGLQVLPWLSHCVLQLNLDFVLLKFDIVFVSSVSVTLECDCISKVKA